MVERWNPAVKIPNLCLWRQFTGDWSDRPSKTLDLRTNFYGSRSHTVFGGYEKLVKVQLYSEILGIGYERNQNLN